VKNARKMTIQEATASYEDWLGQQIPLLPEDLERKHDLMRSAPFPFLRATFYRRRGHQPLAGTACGRASQSVEI